MTLRIRNGLFKLPLFPDPPASVHPEPVVNDNISQAYSVPTQGVGQSAAGNSVEAFMNLGGIGHFANAVPFPLRPLAPTGYAIELRVADFELDCRALDAKFDVMFSLSPINIVIPEPPAFGSFGAANVTPAGMFGWSMPPSGPSTSIDPSGMVQDGPLPRNYRGEGASSSMPFTAQKRPTVDTGSGVRLVRSLQLASFELHLQSLASRCVLMHFSYCFLIA